MKLFVFAMALCMPFLLEGQIVSDTVGSGKTLNVEKPRKPTIRMSLPDLPDLKLPARVPAAAHTAGRIIRELEPRLYRELNPRPDFDPEKMNLNLSLKSPAPARLSELLGESPLNFLLYGAAALAGRMNNVLVGEDKMTSIRVDRAVMSRSGVPESAVSGQGYITVQNK
jgi:hypothetical protein